MAVAPRSFWKGHLRLALVTIPIRLVSASSSTEKVQLHQVDRKTKQRIRYQKVASESGDEVAGDDIVRGVEVEPGRYVLVEDDEIDALKTASRHQVELIEFVDPRQIDPMHYERPYYVLPDGEVAEEGYVVIRDALQAAGMGGIGQLTMRGREHLVCLTPLGKGLALTTLRYESELKNADEIFSGIGDISAKADMVRMARQLVEERATTFDAAKFHDTYADALQDLVAAKAKGGSLVDVAGGEPSPSGATVIDFMEALKKSVGKHAGGKQPAGSGDQTKPKSAPASGKGTSKAAAASTKRDPVKRSKSDGKSTPKSDGPSKSKSRKSS